MSADKNCLRWQRALNTIIRKETSKPATLWRFVIIYILSTCGSGAAARLTSFIKYQLFYRVLNLWTDSGLLRASWTSGPKPSVQFYRVILYYDHKVAPQDCFMLDFKLHSVSYFISTFSNVFQFLKTTLKYLLLLSADSLFKSIEKHHIIFWLRYILHMFLVTYVLVSLLNVMLTRSHPHSFQSLLWRPVLSLNPKQDGARIQLILPGDPRLGPETFSFNNHQFRELQLLFFESAAVRLVQLKSVPWNICCKPIFQLLRNSGLKTQPKDRSIFQNYTQDNKAQIFPERVNYALMCV